jgi:uncharacterized protein YjbJ (UPF0337 family)
LCKSSVENGECAGRQESALPCTLGECLTEDHWILLRALRKNTGSNRVIPLRPEFQLKSLHLPIPLRESPGDSQWSTVFVFSRESCLLLVDADVKANAAEEAVSSIGIESQPRRRDMNWDQVQGKWKQVKGQAKEKWGNLTDDDLDVIDGRRQQFVGRVQERYGIAKEVAEKQVDEFVKALKAEKANRAGRG